MHKFHISATGLSLNYMPEYIAKREGFFEEEGLDVTYYVPNPWTIGLTDINRGESQAVIGGIWVPLMYMGRIKNYISFAKIASRCPLFIVSREPVSNDFSWKDLEGKRVLVSGGDGASHYLLTAGCAKEGGADLSKIRFIHDFSTSMLYELFEGGFGDYIVLQPDMANVLMSQNKGHLFCDLTTKGGSVPWSVYYTTEETLQNADNLTGKFTAGLQRGVTWLLEHGGEGCADIIEKNWPQMKVQDGIDTINMFIREGMWTETVEIEDGELTRWQEFLVLGDVLDQPLPYEQVVDVNSFQYAKEKLTLK